MDQGKAVFLYFSYFRGRKRIRPLGSYSNRVSLNYLNYPFHQLLGRPPPPPPRFKTVGCHL